MSTLPMLSVHEKLDRDWRDDEQNTFGMISSFLAIVSFLMINCLTYCLSEFCWIVWAIRHSSRNNAFADILLVGICQCN